MNYKDITEDKWKKILPKEIFSILRKKHTEKPFSGKYLNFKKKELMYVEDVVMNFFHQKQNLIQVVDGLVFIMLLILKI